MIDDWCFICVSSFPLIPPCQDVLSVLQSCKAVMEWDDGWWMMDVERAMCLPLGKWVIGLALGSYRLTFYLRSCPSVPQISKLLFIPNLYARVPKWGWLIIKQTFAIAHGWREKQKTVRACMVIKNEKLSGCAYQIEKFQTMGMLPQRWQAADNSQGNANHMQRA